MVTIHGYSHICPYGPSWNECVAPVNISQVAGSIMNNERVTRQLCRTLQHTRDGAMGALVSLSAER